MKSPANSGFTLIELMIVLCVIGMIAAAVTRPNSRPAASCIAGYLHTTSESGGLRQTLNEQGGGVPC